MIQQSSLLGLYPEEIKADSQRDICTSYAHCSIIHEVVRRGKPRYSSANELIREM